MQKSIEVELKAHLLNLVNDQVLTDDNVEDWHFHAFNEDHYMIGYYNCEQWLKGHDISAFEAIGDIQEYENDNFGEIYTKLDNSETVVNMYVYIQGEELIGDLGADSIEELRELLED